jgi:hypothetical protein
VGVTEGAKEGWEEVEKGFEGPFYFVLSGEEGNKVIEPVADVICRPLRMSPCLIFHLDEKETQAIKSNPSRGSGEGRGSEGGRGVWAVGRGGGLRGCSSSSSSSSSSSTTTTTTFPGGTASTRMSKYNIRQQGELRRQPLSDRIILLQEL